MLTPRRSRSEIELAELTDHEELADRVDELEYTATTRRDMINARVDRLFTLVGELERRIAHLEREHHSTGHEKSIFSGNDLTKQTSATE